MIGRIERVPLRDVWKNEATGFTRWLADNIDILNEILALNLSNAEREKEAGAFSVDLVAEDGSGNAVVIENQLQKSDHDHLGKIITYLTAIDAKTAIWIVGNPRPEHVKAIARLNESGTASFYLLKLETIRVDKSAPAPLLTLIVGPSEEAREAGETKKKIAERYGLRQQFWTGLLSYAKTRTNLHAAISPTDSSCLSTSAGFRGLYYMYRITMDKGSAELIIDRGRESEEENKLIFQKLRKARRAIESAFGGSLEWSQEEGRRLCIVRKIISGGYRDDEQKWPKLYEMMVDAMIRLDKAMKPHIQKLRE